MNQFGYANEEDIPATSPAELEPLTDVSES